MEVIIILSLYRSRLDIAATVITRTVIVPGVESKWDYQVTIEDIETW